MESSNHLGIPQDFMARYNYNMEHKDQWWCSSKAYDEWMNKYYGKYQRFTKAIINQLIIDVEYRISNTPPGVKLEGRPKQYYLVSFDGLKQLEMSQDKQTKLYYIQLERLAHQLTQQAIELKDQKIEEQKQTIADYESMKKAGIIYEIYYKHDRNENYYGCHEGIDPNDRFKTHINAAISSLKLPLYRRIFREGLKHFDIRTIKEVHYYHSDELKLVESNLIDQYKPSFNRGFEFKCPCGKELKQDYAILTHRQECQLYDKKDY